MAQRTVHKCMENKFYICTDLEMYDGGTLICSYLRLLSIWQRFLWLLSLNILISDIDSQTETFLVCTYQH
jgi:hypothetical protein